MPHFLYCEENQLQRTNREFNKEGALVVLPPKLTTDNLEGMAIIQFMTVIIILKRLLWP